MTATAPWTNQALAPSNSRDRGLIDVYTILGKLEVPACAKASVASRVSNQEGYEPIMISNGGIFSSKRDYLPVMDMSFRKGGEDYTQRVHVDVYEPFTGEAYTYRCDGYHGAVGYAPKCQNLFPLEIHDPAIKQTADFTPYIVGGLFGLTNFNRGGNSSVYRYDGTTEIAGTPVPTPGTLTLVALGIVMVLIAGWTNGTRRKRRNESGAGRPGGGDDRRGSEEDREERPEETEIQGADEKL